MDPVSISGRDGRTVTGERRSQDWNGYQWNFPLDEVFDCESAPECCRTCYYKNKGMSKKKKAVIVFLIFAISIILTSLVVRFSLGTIDIIVGVGDQRPIISQETNFSPLLCSEFRMSNIPMPQNPISQSSSSLSSSPSKSHSNNLQIDTAYENPLFDAYVLLDTPYRSYQTASYDVIETMMFPSDDYFNYWAAHFGSGSEVTISLCPPVDIELHVIQGKSSLDELLDSRSVSHSYPDHIFTACSSTTNSNTDYRFTVNSSPDDYAFVFTISVWGLSSGSYTSANVTFSFRRKELTFDAWSLYASCMDVDYCSLPVPNKAQSVMIEMKQNATAWPMTMRTECVPSIGMYFAFFMGVPVGVLVAFGSCGAVLYLCQKSVMNDIERAENRRRSQQSGNRSSSLNSANNTSFGTISRATANRRAFRTTTSPNAPLVDHDVMSAMAEATRQNDLPPTYNEVEHVSTPISERPPQFDDATTGNVHDDDPPSYESIVT